MTMILSFHDYQKRRMPTPGYLDAECRGSGLRSEHTERVLAARRERDALPAAGRDSRGGPNKPPASGGAASDPAPLPLSWRLRAVAYRHRVTIASAVVLVLAALGGWFSTWFSTLVDGSTARFVAMLVLGLVAGTSLGYTAGKLLR